MLILNLFVSYLTIFQTICILTTIGQHLHNNKDNANINYNKNNDKKKLDHHPSTTDLSTKPATTVVQQIINNNDNDDINDNFIIDSTETYNALTTYNPIAVAYPEEHEIENQNKNEKNTAAMAILLQENFHANGLQHQPIEPNDGEDSYINKIDGNIVNGKSHRKLQQQPHQKQQILQSHLQQQMAEINTSNNNKFLRPRRSSSDDLLTAKANHNIQTDRDLFATTSSCIEPKYTFAAEERPMSARFKNNAPFRSYQRIGPCLNKNIDYNNLYRTFLRNLLKMPPQTLFDLIKDPKSESPLDEMTVMKFFETLNLYGEKQLPLYVDEPKFLVVNSQLPPQMTATQFGDIFIPPRGRKSATGKNNIFDLQDQFFPNRGKKSNKLPSKKGRTDDLLAKDMFFPNRGKKQSSFSSINSDDDDLFFPNRGKKLMDDYFQQQKELDSLFKSMGFKRNPLNRILQDGETFVPNRGKKSTFDNFMNEDVFMPNRGKKTTSNSLEKLMKEELFIPNRGRKKRNEGNLQLEQFNGVERNRRDLLTSLSKDNKDTFYVARGRRAKDDGYYKGKPTHDQSRLIITDALPVISPPHQLIASNKVQSMDYYDNKNDLFSQNYQNYDLNESSYEDKLLFLK